MSPTPRWTLAGTAGAAPLLRPPPGCRYIDLLSDLHLGSQVPATAQAFRDYLARTPADALLLLGDVFEVWIGDDLLDAPDSFEGPIVADLRRASERLAVAFQHGNRDFLVGPGFGERAGCLLLPDPVALEVGAQRYVLMHGDALCLDDERYQAFRREVRSPAWGEAFLARPLAQREAIAAQMRAASEARKQQGAAETYGDLDRAAMVEVMTAAGATQLIHGHTHRPATEALGGGLTRWVLSDWDLEPGCERPRAEVLRLGADGSATRLSLHEACTQPAAA